MAENLRYSFGKYSILGTDLVKAAQAAAKATAGKGSLPVAEMLRFCVHPGEDGLALTVSGYDLTIYAEATVEIITGKTEHEMRKHRGSPDGTVIDFGVHASVFTQVMSQANPEEVISLEVMGFDNAKEKAVIGEDGKPVFEELEGEDGKVMKRMKTEEIICKVPSEIVIRIPESGEDATLTFRTAEPSNFPALSAEFDPDSYYILTGADITLLTQVSAGVSTDMTRPTLTGVGISINGDTAATNGYQLMFAPETQSMLGLYQFVAEKWDIEGQDLVIKFVTDIKSSSTSGKLMAQVLGKLGPEDEIKVFVSNPPEDGVNRNNVHFRMESKDGVIVFPVETVRFPEYKAIIKPEGEGPMFKLNGEAFLKALKVVMAFNKNAGQEMIGLRFAHGEDSCTLHMVDGSNARQPMFESLVGDGSSVIEMPVTLERDTGWNRVPPKDEEKAKEFDPDWTIYVNGKYIESAVAFIQGGGSSHVRFDMQGNNRRPINVMAPTCDVAGEGRLCVVMPMG